MGDDFEKRCWGKPLTVDSETKDFKIDSRQSKVYKSCDKYVKYNELMMWQVHMQFSNYRIPKTLHVVAKKEHLIGNVNMVTHGYKPKAMAKDIIS